MKKLILLFIPFVFACGNESLADKLCNCLQEDLNNWSKYANGSRENALVMDIIGTENLKCNEYWESPEYTSETEIDDILDNSCPYDTKWDELVRRYIECPECIAEKY
tara:strand:+ start:4412 stop:4732 length:321 start_codon:yes stop_codon:yes gene_type:complete